MKGAIEATRERRDRNIVTSVSDQGPGVPSDFRKSIFEKIFQVVSSENCARGGTALGLSIYKPQVEHNGGAMGYEDRPGSGVRFWFSLPGYS
jgi:K+-sensing histidine kinase KdpD